jgi:hypothetical protein
VVSGGFTNSQDLERGVMEHFFGIFHHRRIKSTNYDQKKWYFWGYLWGYFWGVGMLVCCWCFFCWSVTVSGFGFGILFRCGVFGYFGDTLLLTFAWDTLIHSRGFLL